MFHDYYIRTSTKAECENSLVESGLAKKQGDKLYPAAGVNLDIIGVWYEITYDTDGEAVITAFPDYHANIRVSKKLTANQLSKLPIITTPDTPYRVWE